MKIPALRLGLGAAVFLLASGVIGRVGAQQAQQTPAPPPPPPTLGLENGVLELDTPDFRLKLVKASQTIAALEPKGVATYTPTPTPPRGRGRGGAGADAAPATPTPPPPPPQPLNFDFTPADRLPQRAADGFHHLGDITMRVRTGDTGEWKDYSSATSRKPVTALAASGTTLAAADLAATLPADIPVKVTRAWKLVDGKLILSFDVTNPGAAPVQIGALGIPVVFNNIITGRNLEQAHEICSFFDPAIAGDAGYVQVTRLSGKGPALVVVPQGKTPLEGWRTVNDRTPRTQTSEGIFEWMPHTQAYVESEWKNAEPWNAPTMATLKPGETRTYALALLISPSIREVEDTLAKAGRPVAVGIPGYVAPTDQDMKLFLRYPARVFTVEVFPAQSMVVTPGANTRSGWKQFTLRGQQWGRSRVTVKYADGTNQVVSYYVTKPAATVVSDLGNFLFTKQWYENPNDPFRRSPSVMSYDRAKNRIVDQDARVWIAGLGDEGGSGSWLAAAMKLFGQPTQAQIDQYDRFVDGVLWGGIQYSDGPKKYGVRKSLLYYDPKDKPDFPYDPALNWTTWTSWNKTASEDTGRAYNYVHVVGAYWSMYQVARNHEGLKTKHPWDWYLDQAYNTMMFLTDPANRVGYTNVGLMGASVFTLTLEDMKREGWSEKVAALEARMKTRADRWAAQRYPFGSEMAWDSTGQEEVFAWTKYFGHGPQSLTALSSIIGYMPLIPHWGYNGSARRYWDFIYAGAPGSRYERQLHHYGSGLNAIPVLSQYRQQPDDLHLLRIGYAGTMGALTNIDQEGFGSVAFHAFPESLKWDAYSGDYGPNFLGHTLNTGTYLINHPEFGWQAFGGNVTTTAGRVSVQVLDSLRKRVYIAPLGLYLTLDAGQFQRVTLDTRTNAVTVTLAPATPATSRARLRMEQPFKAKGVPEFTTQALERGALNITLGAAPVSVTFTSK
jgi:hypothetical protein